MRGCETCYGHSSAHAEQRRRNARKGGKSGGRGRGGELAELKGEIRRVTASVLAGELKTAPAAVALQGLNSSLRALEIERRTFDVAALMERLDALERRADLLRGAS